MPSRRAAVPAKKSTNRTAASYDFGAIPPNIMKKLQQEYGYSNAQQNPFASSPQIFTNSTFGGTSTTFGQSSAPMFGAPQQPAPLFGSSATTSFGSANQNAFGNTNLFGQPNQTQPNTLFGAPSTSFGQPNKPGGFTFPSTQASLFGQSAQPQQPAGNVFQPAGSSNIFGNSGFGSAPAQSGTVIKFVPATGTDSMQKGGSSTVISTKHHSITCMKEYESKSFEELRYEDYCAGRKGPQQQPGFGAPAQPFGAAPSTASLFGQPDNKPAFGTGNGFGQTSTFGLTTQPGTSQGVFGKPPTPFGSTTTAGNFGFTSTASTNVFGSPAKPFGAQPTQPLFGSTQQQPATSFGTSTFFGQPTTQPTNTNFFKPTQPAFPSAQTGSFAFGQTPASTQTNNLFQTTKPSTGFSLFGMNTTTSTAFGQPTSTGFGGFNAFAKPAQNTFAQPPPQQTTGFSLPTSNLFGGIGSKPAFGTGTTGTGLFGRNDNAFSLQPQPLIQAHQLTAPSLTLEMRTLLSLGSPYGYSPHLAGLTPKPVSTHYVTNPKELEEINRQELIRSPPANVKKVKVQSALRMSWSMFNTSYDIEPYDGVERRNLRRLNIPKMTKKPDPIIVIVDGKIVGGPPTTSGMDSGVTSLPHGIRSTPPSDALSTSSGAPLNFGLPAGSDTPIAATPMASTSPPVACTSTSTTPTTGMQAVKTGGDVNRKSTETSGIIALPEVPENDEASINRSLTLPAPASTPKYSTCGIICTRPEYYTIPPLEEIGKYKNEDGSCYIKGFTIGRMGYGNVYFPDIMDVSNLDIDKLVHFRFREICIYPDDTTKPPLGEELNRKAQVTLDQVYPKKKDSQTEYERDPMEILRLEYPELLKYACLKAGTYFVDYRPETGSWVFKVLHFSVYGMNDGNESVVKQEVLKRIEESSNRRPSSPGAPGPTVYPRRLLPIPRQMGGVPKGELTEIFDPCVEEYLNSDEGHFPGVTPKMPVTHRDLHQYLNMKPVSSTGIDTCGVICTRPDYYTIPSLDELPKHRMGANCFIKGFTIGRIGYGHVFFPDLMDVANLNIDQVVHFRNREICLYPDEAKKPPRGIGLNRRAQVTLHQVCHQVGTGEFETDENLLEAIKFHEILKATCDKLGVNFTGYKSEADSWVFDVPHFSIYELTEILEQRYNSYSSTRDLALALDARATATFGLGGVVQSRTRSKAQQHSSLDFDLDQSMEICSTEAYSSAMTGAHKYTKRKSNMNTNVEYMKKAFFGKDISLLKEKSGILDVVSSVQDISALRTICSEVPLSADDNVKSKELNIYMLKNLTNRMPLLRSLIPGKGYMDAAILKGRSFKVGWARGFTLATVLCEEISANDVGVNIVERELYSPRNVLLLDVSHSYKLFIVNTEKQDDPFAQQMLERCMEAVLQESSCEMQNFKCKDGLIPFWCANNSKRLIQEMCTLWSEGRKRNPQNCRLHYYGDIFNLCLAFWGPIVEPDFDYIVRKDQFNKWLTSVTSELVERDLMHCMVSNFSMNLKKIIVYLSGHQIKKATQLAFESNLPQLALLISQLNSSDRMKFIIQQQIHKWTDVTAANYIDEDVMKLYLMLCGVPFFNDTNIFDYMDWIRALAMHMWYLASPNEPFTNIVGLYEDAFSLHTYAEKPYPMYCTSTKTWDVLYHIIRLYCQRELDIGLIVSPTTHTEDPIDYRLSWLLMQTLFSLEVGSIDENAMDHITTIFSSQLEQKGMYKWAIFVCLFVSDICAREYLVMGILDRNIRDDTSEGKIEQSIVKDLNIPTTWIHNLKALKNIQLDRHWLSYRHHIYSKMWLSAHDIFYQNIVPTLVCNGHFKLLQSSFHPVAEHGDEISEYDARLGVLLLFIKFWAVLHKRPVFPPTNMVGIYNNICNFIGQLKGFQCESVGLTIAISEVSKHCAEFFNYVLRELHTRERYDRQASKQLGYLIMPLDYKFEEIRKFVVNASQFFKGHVGGYRDHIRNGRDNHRYHYQKHVY